MVDEPSKFQKRKLVIERCRTHLDLCDPGALGVHEAETSVVPRTKMECRTTQA